MFKLGVYGGAEHQPSNAMSTATASSGLKPSVIKPAWLPMLLLLFELTLMAVPKHPYAFVLLMNLPLGVLKPFLPKLWKAPSQIPIFLLSANIVLLPSHLAPKTPKPSVTLPLQNTYKNNIAMERSKQQLKWNPGSMGAYMFNDQL